ncbi:AbrB family transcriptional regulator [Sinorhizobium sp. 7-81]|uniref:AbrB family transcriptional regulator n=1 Tax=unclassified Sinorhizobium TaxID=2613772 RepID=UPI0024C33B7E|nr:MULTISPECIES: AbrB family transcriptional regulator [unclassified Sinorhizobium]MDK1389317.1 AbrB family transcriptional regulator [Sinorhizobium sp. 7-81]MDK1493597.1 AbrB family transcriptional regulator [Sinorhizobium sp. 8-89]
MRKTGAPVVEFALTLALGALGGWAMWHFDMPLAWLAGAIIATGVGGLLRLPVAMPPFARPPMTAALGAMLGTSFSPAMFEHTGSWLLSLGGLAVFIAAAGALFYIYFRRVAGFDHATAYFSAMPGGLVDMVTLGIEEGGDEKMIALVHAVRIFLVALSLPFLIQSFTGVALDRTAAGFVPLASIGANDLLWFSLAVFIGAGAGILLRLPARYLLGPMSASAIMHVMGLTHFQLPSSASAAAQIVIGATIGCRFAMAPPRKIMEVVGLSFGSTGLLLSMTLSFAGVLSYLTGDPFTALVLAYSPGGVAEMSLIALSLGVEVPFVVLHHIVRLILVMVGAAAVFRWVKR